jgi:hypothetical protein
MKQEKSSIRTDKMTEKRKSKRGKGEIRRDGTRRENEENDVEEAEREQRNEGGKQDVEREL